MQVRIKEDKSIDATYVEIGCKSINQNVVKLKTYIDNYRTEIMGKSDGDTHMVSVEDIFYIESVDKKTFICTQNQVLETDKRLYELEEFLDNRYFFRCSKSMIINLSKVIKLKPEITRNILATLANNEVVIVSRRYVAELKRLLGIINS